MPVRSAPNRPMPSLHPSATVLVTGSSGFLGSWICDTLLRHGFRVVGTVRHIWQGEQLMDLFLDGFPDRFTYAIVEDIAQPHALDSFLAGVHAIIHCASPVICPDNPDEVLIPAVNGTREMLISAQAYGRSLKRVIVTSSIFAMQEPNDLRLYFDEDDWNEESIRTVLEQGRAAPNQEKYRAAKTLAEHVVWGFAAEHGHDLPFDVSVVVPGYMSGPPLQDVLLARQLNHSTKKFYEAILASRRNDGPGPSHSKDYVVSFVDVRDAAEVHVRAIECEDAGGLRIVASAGPVTLEDIDRAVGRDATSVQSLLARLEKLAEALKAGAPIFRPRSELEDDWDRSAYPVFDSERAKSLLGRDFRCWSETARDTIDVLTEWGILD